MEAQRLDIQMGLDFGRGASPTMLLFSLAWCHISVAQQVIGIGISCGSREVASHQKDIRQRQRMSSSCGMLFKMALNVFDNGFRVRQVNVSQVGVQHMARPVGHAEGGHIGGWCQVEWL